ncbi:MAG: AAA family ATPase [Alphaproteobacteria bacterium]|nr:AAA family ATPase [Alphaproteobacteria bacterium]
MSTIYYLIGYPGVGKYTVAQALAERTGARIVDNHLANNPIFSLLPLDGITAIPEAAWERVKAIRDIVFDTMEHLSPREFSFILTNVLHDDEGDRSLFAQVEALAKARSSLFIPVLLSCTEEENCRRVTSPGRAKRLKDTSAENVRTLRAEKPLLPVAHPNTLRLDTTMLAAEEVVEKILAVNAS